MSVPNWLTLFRFASAPVFLAVFIGSGHGGFLRPYLSDSQGLWLCLIIAALSELSDILDGILARRLNQVTNFGKLLDPYADSVFRLTCYFAFASQAHGRWVPIWMVMVLFYRDLLVTVVRNCGIEQGVYVHARASGKIKAIAQGTVVIVVLVFALLHGEEAVALESPRQSAFPTGVAHALMWLVTAVTAWSAFDYAWHNRHLFRTGKAGVASPQKPAEK